MFPWQTKTIDGEVRCISGSRSDVAWPRRRANRRARHSRRARASRSRYCRRSAHAVAGTMRLRRAFKTERGRGGGGGEGGVLARTGMVAISGPCEPRHDEVDAGIYSGCHQYRVTVCHSLPPPARITPSPPSGARLPRSAARILVLDGEERASLATVRALVASGFDVTVAAGRRWSLAGAARGAAAVQLAHHPLRAPASYAQEVAALSRRLGTRVVIPVTDASADAMLEHRALLPDGCEIPFASLDVYRAASDKARIHAEAAALGIGVPASALVTRPDEGAPEAGALYPGVVKPHRSVIGDGQARRKTGVRFVADRAACARALAELPIEAFPVLVQGRVHGPGEGVFLARWNGRTLARFAHRRLREKPPAGGVSVFRESIAMDPGVLAACEALLDRLDWQGVAMIEGKRDLATGRWCVMEINGRFWGSLQLAIEAGVDFPSLLVRALLGDPPEPVPEWRAGVRLRWEWGDVDHLLIRLRRSRERLALPADAPGRLGAFARFLAHRPGRDRLEVLQWRDPLPFVVETLARMGLIR